MAGLIALYTVAVLFGGMIFFTAVMAPLVFTRLPPDEAGKFIRAVFPVYYLYVLTLSAIAALALLALSIAAAAGAASVALLALWLRQWLMPRINGWSDAARAGDVSAKWRFDRAHRTSVIVNGVQLAIVALVLARFSG